MNAGRLAAGAIVLTGVLAGALIWWLQVYAYYQPAAFAPGEGIALTPLLGGLPEEIVADNLEGIDAGSSPLRFRACFTTPLSQSMLSETYQLYATPTPLVAPGWFGCYDAARISAALQSGEALAFLSVHDIHPGIDRVVAVFPDGHAYAWHQLNDELKD